jgi:hypothetical protein
LEERAQYIEKKNSDILIELQTRIKSILEQTKPESAQSLQKNKSVGKKEEAK